MDTNGSTHDDDNNPSIELDYSDTKPIRHRKRKSMVWNHFTVESAAPGTTKACCIHCNKSYAYKTGTKTSGTSHLKRHIELGICPMSNGVGEISKVALGEVKDETVSPGPPKRRQRASPTVAIDHDRCNREMAKMIIMHEYPLNMVEHSGFTGFVKAICPQFNMASYNTIHSDCVDMFLKQKQKLLESVGEIPGAVNLAIDLWSSNQSIGYAFVTGHFLDKDWNLRHLLLNVSPVVSLDSDFALNQTVMTCLSDWKLEGKVSSITVSQSLVNKTATDNLRGFLSGRNQHVLSGQLLMGNCLARLLSSMAKEALSAEQVQTPIKKVRDSIKYILTNEACRDRFDEVKRQFEIPSSDKDLLLDNQSRWDTSYNMLLNACEHRKVFSCLETCHPGYKISITTEEWKNLESLCSCLKFLFEAASLFTAPNNLTANDLYHEMIKLQVELSQAAMGEDADVRNLAKPLREKFDMYWIGCFLVLSVAVVLDPRFKMHFVGFSFTKSYGEEAEKWIKTVGDAVNDLYLNYSEHNLLDAYVDHGFSETEVAQETQFHEAMLEDANTGNGQSADETSPQVEQTTDSHTIAEEGHTVEQTTEGEGQIKVEKESKGVSDDCQLTEEQKLLGDGSEACPIAEQQELVSDTEAQPIEEEKKLGDDSQAYPVEEEQQVGGDTEAQPIEEEQKLGDDSETQPIGEEEQLCDGAEEHPIGEKEEQLVDGAEAQPIEEDQELGDGSQAQPIGEEEEQLGNGSEPTAELGGDSDGDSAESQELGGDSDAQLIREEQKLSDGSQAQPIGEDESKLVDGSEAQPITDHQELDGDSEAQPIGEEEQQVDDSNEEHPVAEHQKLDGDSETQPIGVEEQKLGDGTTEGQPIEEKEQELGGESEAQPMEEDGSEAHQIAEEEDHTTFLGDVLLQEGSTLVTIGDSLSDFDIYISDMKTELEQYLEESLIPRSEEFNVLSWWRLNSTKYPTLSKMAADMLSIPLSTVSSDSVFDTEVKHMDSYRTSLPRVTLEALFCAKDWFKNQTL